MNDLALAPVGRPPNDSGTPQGSSSRPAGSVQELAQIAGIEMAAPAREERSADSLNGCRGADRFGPPLPGRRGIAPSPASCPDPRPQERRWISPAVCCDREDPGCRTAAPVAAQDRQAWRASVCGQSGGSPRSSAESASVYPRPASGVRPDATMRCPREPRDGRSQPSAPGPPRRATRGCSPARTLPDCCWRAVAREREFAVCAAIGASRGRLVDRSLVECLVLAMGAAGPWGRVKGHHEPLSPSTELLERCPSCDRAYGYRDADAQRPRGDASNPARCSRHKGPDPLRAQR